MSILKSEEGKVVSGGNDICQRIAFPGAHILFPISA
jgi:hypothetical protein